MRKPSLTVDTFVAALAVLGASASVGCSKQAASVSAEPAAQSTPASPGAAQAASGAAPLLGRDENASPPPAQPNAAAPSPSPAASSPKPKAAVVGATPVDGGKPGAVRANENKNPSASCGAGGCTPDMKKGSGN